MKVVNVKQTEAGEHVLPKSTLDKCLSGWLRILSQGYSSNTELELPITIWKGDIQQDLQNLVSPPSTWTVSLTSNGNTYTVCGTFCLSPWSRDSWSLS